MGELTRWEPRGLEPLSQAMQRLFEDSFVGPFWGRAGEGMAALDMYETDNDIVVKVTVPGVKPEDLQVSVVGDTLTIKGESKAEQNVEERNYIRREIRHGSFTRTVSLPGRINANEATAEFENGVLTLTVPKSEEARPKAVQVKVKK